MRLTVRVHPRASRARRTWDGQTLHLWVTEAPVDGAANDAVIRAVADWLSVAKGRVQLISGATSRSKAVEVDDIHRLPAAEAPSE